MDIHVDLLVIGGGPAGALTALLVARARPGLRIALLEAQQAPRHRPCGEYLAPGGVAVLARAGLLPAVLAMGAAPLARMALHGPRGGFSADFAAPPCAAGPSALGVRRERLDAVLQDAAAGCGVDLSRATRLLRLERVEGGWLALVDERGARRALRSALVVGADGRQSLVRRQAGLDRPTTRRRFALACRASRVPHGGTVEMHLGPLGQVGLCPLGDGEVNLNLLLSPASSPLLRRIDPDVLLRLALASTPTLAARCREARIGTVLASGSLPHESRGVVADGLCLVGDAAGFCDPVTGEGMTLALQGAEALGEVLAVADLRSPPSAVALAPYTRAYAAGVGRRRQLGGHLQAVLDRRRLSEAVAGILGRLPRLARQLAPTE